MNRTYGSKYIANATTTEIAKLIRTDIKQAVKEGRLPKGKYGVRTQYYSGGSSISVKLSDLKVATILSAGFMKDGNKYLMGPSEPTADGSYERPSKYSAEVHAALKAVEVIVDAYNHDGSDSMSDYFDVKFYAHVDVDGTWERDSLAFAAFEASTKLECDVCQPSQVDFLRSVGAL